MFDSKRFGLKFRRALLHVVVLSRIKREPVYGYELMKHVKLVWSVRIGANVLYPLCALLEAD